MTTGQFDRWLRLPGHPKDFDLSRPEYHVNLLKLKPVERAQLAARLRAFRRPKLLAEWEYDKRVLQGLEQLRRNVLWGRIMADTMYVESGGYRAVYDRVLHEMCKGVVLLDRKYLKKPC